MQKPVIFVVDRNPIHRNLVKYHLELQNFAIVQSSLPAMNACTGFEKAHNPTTL